MKVAVQKHTIPDSQIFSVKYLSDKHFDPVWHSHLGYQLFASLEGTGTRFIGDSIKAIGQNELILTGINLPHLWRSDDAYFEKDSKLQVKGIVIYLQESFLGEHLMQKEELIMVKKFLKKSARGIEYYGNIKLQVIKMMKELLQLQGLESLIHLLKILNLLATTKDYHYISHTAYSNPFKENETNRMNQVYDYALKNFRKKELLKEMSEHLHMTPTSFSRYFSSKNNKSFSKFISELRIKHACKLLTETDIPISNISYECGFNTLSNFNKQFKEVMMKKPSDYKKEFLTL